MKPVMEDFINNSVRDITVQCAAQSSKTQTVDELRLLKHPAARGRQHRIVDQATRPMPGPKACEACELDAVPP